jgi:hypothetical protein
LVRRGIAFHKEFPPLQVKKNAAGKHRWTVEEDVEVLVRELARRHCHIELVEAVIDRGEARLRHWNRVAGLSPGRQ